MRHSTLTGESASGEGTNSRSSLATGLLSLFGAKLASPQNQFADLIGKLSDSLSSAKPLVASGSPLDLARTGVSEVDSALDAVGTFDSVLTDITDLVAIVAGLADALSAVPFVDAVAGPIAEVLDDATDLLGDVKTTFDDLYKETVEPVKVILDDVQKGLADVEKVITEITVTVPQYLNTVQILDYLLQVATPITEVLAGTTPGDRVKTVVDDLDKVMTAVGKALTPFSAALEVVIKGVKGFAGVIKEVFDAMGNGVRSTLKAFTDVGNLLKPISNGFHKVENAIAPIKWVLEAVECIIKKILEPVMNWVLKVTGLQKYVDEAKDWLLQKIGIKPLIDAMGPVKSNHQGVKKDQASVGTGQAGTTSTALKDFTMALGQFRNNKNKALQDASYGLLTAITGTPIDPNKGSVIPDFPSMPPDLHGNDNASSPRSNSGGLARSFQCVAEAHSGHACHHRVLPFSLLTLDSDGPHGSSDPPPVAPVDPHTWPNSAAMIAGVHEMIGNVQSLSADVGVLQSSLKKFQGSLTLPKEFSAQIGELESVFKTTSDFVGFVLEFDVSFLNDLAQPVQDVVEGQLKDASTITTDIPTLAKAVKDLEGAAQVVIADMPKTTLVDTAIHRMDGWVLGLQQLVATMERGYAAAKAASGSSTTELDAGKKQIESSAAALSTRLEGTSKSVAGMDTGVKSLQGALDTYSNLLASLSAHSQTISQKSLPALGHVARIMGTVDSIFDPLSSLLKAEKCVDEDAPAKSAAAVAGGMIKDAANAAAKPPPNTLPGLIEDFADTALPLGEVATAVNQAASTISGTVVSAFQQHSQTLGTQLTALGEYLTHTEEYETEKVDPKTLKPVIDPQTGKPVMVKVPNDIVNQEFVDRALKDIRGQSAVFSAFDI